MSEVDREEYETMYMQLCLNIKNALKTRLMKQEELAWILGIPPKNLSAKLCNRKGEKLNLLQIKKIADELLMTVDELLAR